MSEPNSEPRKDGGQPPQPQPSDKDANKARGDKAPGVRDAADVELEDSPGGLSGGLIDEG